MTRPRRVGLPWYAPEDYAALRASLADGAKLPRAYDTWCFATEQMQREVERSDIEVVRVPIEPDAFAAWCAGAGLEADAAACAWYAAKVIAAAD